MLAVAGTTLPFGYDDVGDTDVPMAMFGCHCYHGHSCDYDDTGVTTVTMTILGDADNIKDPFNMKAH